MRVNGIVWKTVAPMSVPRTDLGVAAVNNKIYAIGGYSGSILTTVEEYDPVSNIWTTKADMPSARAALVVVAVNNKIYAIGGMNYTDPNNVDYIFTTEVYDPATNTWETKTPMPTLQASTNVLGNLSIGGAAINGKIYIIVLSYPGPTTQTFEYDPAADVWSTKAPVPFTYNAFNYRFSVTSLNGKIYALGHSNSGSSKLAEYSPDSDIWVIKPPMQTNRGMTGFLAAGGKLYSIGGYVFDFSVGTALNTVEEYDLSTEDWAFRSSIRTFRISPSVAEVEGKIYVIGGAANTTSNPVPLTSVEEGTFQN